MKSLRTPPGRSLTRSFTSSSAGLLVSCAAALLLAACGGGEPGTPAPPVAEPVPPVVEHGGSDVTQAPRLQASSLVYEGAFRLPVDDFGASSINYSLGALAVDAARGSLYIVGHPYQQAVAEFALPSPGAGTVLSSLPLAAAPRQGFAPLLDRVANPQAVDTITGLTLLRSGGRTELLVNGIQYYDAAAQVSHTTLMVRDATQLASAQVQGYYALQGAAHAAGWVAEVPAAWQAGLGGTHLAGHASGWPIISRLSVGPSAFLFRPADLAGAPGSVATQALLDFSLDHPLHADLANDSRSNQLWTHLSSAAVGFVVPGTRTYVTIGSSGGHRSGVCYKCAPTGQTEACGGYCARDDSDYSAYYWLWDLNDLQAVREGRKQPWEPRPYAFGPLALPFGIQQIGGGSFDAASGRLYLSAPRADTSQGLYTAPPLIVVMKVKPGG